MNTFNPSMRQPGFFKVVGCQHIVVLVNLLSHVSLDGSGFPVARTFVSMRVTVSTLLTWIPVAFPVRRCADSIVTLW